MLSLNLVAYDRMGLCNPVSQEAVDALLDATDLKPGDRAAELGCGNAALAALVARRGLSVSAFDRGEAMADLARRRITREGLADRVTVEAGEAADLAEAEAPFRLITVMGATALGDFGRLHDWLEPGGWLLWGDLFWKAEPSEGLRAAMGHPDYDTDAGWRARGEAAGLELIEARHSAGADWDAYVTALQAAIDGWAADHPGHPGEAGIRRHLAGMAALYGPAGREHIGFGLYLFRRPA